MMRCDDDDRYFGDGVVGYGSGSGGSSPSDDDNPFINNGPRSDGWHVDDQDGPDSGVDEIVWNVFQIRLTPRAETLKLLREMAE